jgi:hypothetical protein
MILLGVAHGISIHHFSMKGEGEKIIRAALARTLVSRVLQNPDDAERIIVQVIEGIQRMPNKLASIFDYPFVRNALFCTYSSSAGRRTCASKGERRCRYK